MAFNRRVPRSGCLLSVISTKMLTAPVRAPEFVPQRRRVGKKRNAGAVGALRDRFRSSDRAIFLQSHGHRALIMGHRLPIRPIEAPRAAPFVRAELRLLAPKLGRGVIEVGDAAVRVGRVDRHR